jgi:tripartite-type tricarboxylate transporter receptor subunit TctC
MIFGNVVLRRACAALVVTVAAIALRTLPACAADYPSRPVKIIVPFGAGGPTDVYVRALAIELEKALQQTFVIENRPGAGTTIGTDLVAKSAPDGYMLLMASSTQTVNETLYKNKPYKLLRDLVPIAPLEENDLVLVVNPSVPAKNLAQLLALARAKPGTLNFGSSGPGSNYHMAAELLKNLTGIDIVHVPYKGSTGMRIDILSGQIQMLFDSIPTMAPYVKAGKVRALGTTGLVRSPILPDVPTIAETVPGFQFSQWVGFMAPKGTPAPIIAKLHDAITAILSRPDLKKAWAAQGVNPMVMTQPQFAAFMQAQVDKWAKVIKTNHITLIN